MTVYRVRRRSNPIAISFILVLVGLIIFSVGIFVVKRSLDSEAWVETKGVVVDSYVKREYDSEDKDYTYYPIVKYQFQAEDGKIYTGENFSPTGGRTGSSIRSYAENKISKYPKGMEVTVYYDKNDPSNNALSRGFEVWTVIIPVVGAVMILGGLFLGIVLKSGKGKKITRQAEPSFFSGATYGRTTPRAATGGALTYGSYDSTTGLYDSTPSIDEQSYSSEELPQETQVESTPVEESETKKEEQAELPVSPLFSKKTCFKCGTSNNRTDKFCVECGNELK